MVDNRRNLPSNEDLETILAVAKARARSCGANEDESDEIAQSTAVRLWEKWNDPHIQQARERGDVRWRGYIRQTARNLHLDRIREHQRRMARQRLAVIDVVIAHRPVHSQSPVPISPCAADALLARALIAEEILRLPAEQCAVAALYYLDELSISEIAELRGVQAQTVRKHLRLAQHTLTDRLGGQLG